MIVDGKRIAVPGVNVTTWLDDPKRAPRVTDGATRKVPPCAVVLHTSRGVRGGVREGSRPSTLAETLALYQARTAREVSWHITVDTDGDVLQQADASTWTCWHAGRANAWSVGIELVQAPDTGDLWRVQVDAAVRVVDALCGALSIPRRVPVTPSGRPVVGVVAGWVASSVRWAGVIGHRNLTSDRGPGDPGDAIFDALLAAGFEGAQP
jgi:hypothetical protein